MSELSIHELDAQHGEVLPEREALGRVGNITFTKSVAVAHVNASNHATVMQEGGLTGTQTASAVATQSVSVVN